MPKQILPKSLKSGEKEQKRFFDIIKAQKAGCSDYNYVSLEEQESDNKPFLEGDDDFISVGDEYI